MKAIHNKWGALRAEMGRCELYTKIQKMKAIHNELRGDILEGLLWTIHKDTKNESNSQLRPFPCVFQNCCELYTKIQKMKAIHNDDADDEMFDIAVNYTQRYKKWKQFTTGHTPGNHRHMLWTIHKDTKNESNSQLSFLEWRSTKAVNYTQRYKKWKQFTTLQR